MKSHKLFHGGNFPQQKSLITGLSLALIDDSGDGDKSPLELFVSSWSRRPLRTYACSVTSTSLSAEIQPRNFMTR